MDGYDVVLSQAHYFIVRTPAAMSFDSCRWTSGLDKCLGNKQTEKKLADDISSCFLEHKTVWQLQGRIECLAGSDASLDPS